jgi:uncharacterized delta-60 repeat protein
MSRFGRWFLCCCVMSHGVFAADGELDPDFGAQGKITVDMGDDDFTSAMVVAPDGRIYLAGPVENPSKSGVIRLLPDGTLDWTYGIGGKVTLQLGSYLIGDAALQPNGKLVFATYDDCGNCEVKQQVCRLTATGSGLDTGFGDPVTPGCRVLQNDNDLLINALAVQTDGKIVLAGRKNNQGWLFRLDAQGDPDGQFGVGGEVLLTPMGHTDLNDVAVAPDGKIVAVGLAGSPYNFEVFRLQSNGSLDQLFGPGGRRTAAFDLGGSNYDFAHAVHVLADGSILVAGTAASTVGDIPAMAKVRGVNGAPDLSFGPGGKRSYNPCGFVVGGCEFSIRDMLVQSDDTIVIAGSREFDDGVSSDFFAMRIRPDGAPDTSFGIQSGVPQGAAYVPFDLFNGESADYATRVTMHNGHLLLAGSASTDGSFARDFAVARLRNDLVFTDDYER